MLPVEKRMLIKVANMYYYDHMKQVDIAKRLGVERTTISKYLKKAFDHGIVKIVVENGNYEELEVAMERRFGLKEVYIVPRSYDLLAVKQNMARAGLNLLRRIVAPNQVIGLSWGTTIRELVNLSAQERLPKSKFNLVPLVGGPENINSEYHVNTLCYQFSRAFDAQCQYLYAPAITRTAEIRQAIMQDANYEKISAFWEKLNIGIVGIGAQVKSSNLIWVGDFGREAIESLYKTGAVGEICSIFFDKNGKEVKTDFSERTIAVDLDKLRNLDYSIGIAASREKVTAISGALHGHIINVLITDELTAKLLLNE